MTVDWTAETLAWIVLAISMLYLADRLVIWVVTRYWRRTKADRVDRSSGRIL
jgi:hypothetical protein